MIDNKNTLRKMSIDEILDTHYNEQNRYYTGLVKSVFNEYLKLDEFVAFIKGKDKVTDEDIINTFETVSPNISTIEKINTIEKFLAKINNFDEIKRKNFFKVEDRINRINKEINTSKKENRKPKFTQLDEFYIRHNITSLRFINDLHHSYYKKSNKLTFNQMLK